MKNDNENNKKDQNENNEMTEISNDSPRVPSTNVALSPRVIFPNKLPATINKSTQKPTTSILKPSKNLKAPIIQHSSNSIATRTRSKSCRQPIVTTLKQNSSVASHTRSQLAFATSHDKIRKLTYRNNEQLTGRAIRNEIANAILNPEIGQMMEYRHLIKYRNLNMRAIWTTSAANELGYLFQGVGSNANGGQKIKGTNTFFFI